MISRGESGRALKIGVLTGGGDCPGLNAVIKWVVRGALDEVNTQTRGRSFEVVGIRDGWRGLLDCQLESGVDQAGLVVPFTGSESVRTIDRKGGTVLGTSRADPFSFGEAREDHSSRLMRNVELLGLDGLVVVGGEGTLSVAHRLSEAGLPVVGVPKTIDMDIAATDYSIGFESAVAVIMSGIDSLRTTAGSHSRIFIVETMGRYSGHLALQGAIAGGAFMVLLPEFEFDVEAVARRLERRRDRGMRYAIVVVAEGARPVGGTYITQGDRPDSFGRPVLGGIGAWLQDQIEEISGYQPRSVVLSHLQRGGSPCAFDRRLGRLFGLAAVELIEQGAFGQMVAWRDGRVDAVSLELALATRNVVHENLYDHQRYRPSYRALA